ncbi:hypothetical protein Vafri_12236 [Volvox africanus]|uniref:CCHC-type domain-containing protein n=2 Tax=Volvox africanus TaxID=51714 RepID=A0A8J4F489_9CHLO|nr:hypothetical protein Vafri_12236 [Volvox africanus]
MEALADPAVRVALLRSLSHDPVERAQQLRRLNQFLSEQFWGPSNQPEAPHPRWGQQDQPAAGPSARPRRPSRWDQGPQEVPVPVPTNVVPETVFAPAPGTARPAATVNAPADTVTTPAATNGSAMGAARAAAVPASPVPVTPVPVVPAVPDTVASTEAGPSTLPSAETRQTAARNARTSTLRAYSLNAQGLDPEMEDAEVPPLPKRMRTMPAVTVPVAAAAVSDPNPAALGGPSASRRMRVGPPGKRLSVAENRESQALGACFGCGSTDHQWRLCPENPNAKKGLKASGGVVKHKGSKGPKNRNKGQGKGKGNDA